MSKFKKVLSMGTAYVLVSALAIGATIAYLTDTDSDVNVMTVGNVQIVQKEQQRVEKDGQFTPELEPFEQNKILMPVTYPGNRTADTVTIGDYTIELSDNEANYVDKIVSVTNTGKSAAYVRTLVAVPTGGDEWEPNAVSADNCWLHWNYPKGQEWKDSWTLNSNYSFIEIDGEGYYVWEFTHKTPVEANKTTYPVIKGFYMDKRVDNDSNGYYITYSDGTTKRIEDVSIGDSVNVLVISQAVQADGFTDAATALDEAFGVVNKEKAAEWFGGIVAENNNIPADAVAVSSFEQLKIALAKGGNIKLTANVYVPETLDISVSAAIYGQGYAITRADGYTGTVFSVKTDSNLTMENITLDGRGATATGNLIATEGNGSIVLNDGAVLQNNVGAHAVSLATRGGGSLTLNGAQIINNSSDSGAIWGGGAIIVNEGSKINGNSSTGSAGAIRMVGGCNLTVNGGEISNNTAVGDGGAIWGYGSSTYNFNGGVIANNKANGSGGAIWTGDGSVVNISGDFELSDNTASDAGALRLSNRTAFNMTGGKVSGNVSVNSDENDGFYGWNPAVNITGGELSDSIVIQGGLTPTVGGDGITGIVNFDLTTNHYDINLASEFGTIKFTVNENDEHFINCNFKPADGYTYTEGDEAKLICMNEGYSTYWNASTQTFCLQADN